MKRLEETGEDALTEAALPGILATLAEEEHRGQAPSPLQLLEDAPPVEARHCEVEDHQVGGRLGEGVERLLSARGGLHEIARALEEPAQDGPDLGVVVHHQDPPTMLLHAAVPPSPRIVLQLDLVGKALAAAANCDTTGSFP